MNATSRTLRSPRAALLHRLFPLACALLLGALAACAPRPSGPPAAEQPTSTAARSASSLLDGRPKSIVIVGYSTSYVWPQMLQELLDGHAGGRTYHVLNAVVGGSPVGRWIAEPGSEEYEETYGAMLRDFFGPDARLRGEAPEPSVALLQQSLQRTPTPATRLGPVSAADDAEGIRIGADAFEKLALQLRADGIEQVWIGTHIYKQGYEPEVGNERFALAALIERGHDFIFAGPDLWSRTLREHPEAFTEDGLHPNVDGSKLMAVAWYRAIAGEGAREDLVEQLMARPYDQPAIMRAYLEWRGGSDGGG